jgi:hypothetical protein
MKSTSPPMAIHQRLAVGRGPAQEVVRVGDLRQRLSVEARSVGALSVERTCESWALFMVTSWAPTPWRESQFAWQRRSCSQHLITVVSAIWDGVHHEVLCSAGLAVSTSSL